ncbi:hypothetical protein [Acidilutibacter cellobiosedens]|nr:hypothetical protein [Acidilutibacter cellobiosedens]
MKEVDCRRSISFIFYDKMKMQVACINEQINKNLPYQGSEER